MVDDRKREDELQEEEKEERNNAAASAETRSCAVKRLKEASSKATRRKVAARNVPADPQLWSPAHTGGESLRVLRDAHKFVEKKEKRNKKATKKIK